jgi:hypothetical protein
MSNNNQTEKYKNADLLNINQAFSGLDGIAKDGIVTPYKFTGDGLVNMIKNRVKLRPIIQAINEVHDRILIQYLPVGQKKLEPNTEARHVFDAQWNEFLGKESDVIEFLPIAFADLNLTENAISPSVIDTLVHYGIVTGLE